MPTLPMFWAWGLHMKIRLEHPPPLVRLAQSILYSRWKNRLQCYRQCRVVSPCALLPQATDTDFDTAIDDMHEQWDAEKVHELRSP